MAQEDVYDPRTNRYVTPHAGTTVRYAFPGLASEADGIALGQSAMASLPGAEAAVFGAQQPQPSRYSRRLATGRSNSGFADFSQQATLLAAGWTKTRSGKYVPSGTGVVGPNSVKVVVDVAANLSLVWIMKRVQYDAIAADLGGLGVEILSTTNNNNAAIGVNRVVGAALFSGVREEADRTYSVQYIDPASVDNLPAGWVAVSNNSGFDETVAPNN
mgnify:CR=1 FL=1